MRWIDIILPEPGTHQKMDSLLNQAAQLSGNLEEIQQRDGLDSVLVIEHMAQVGRLLFQAVMALDPEAFKTTPEHSGPSQPLIGDPVHDSLVGYHLVVDPAWPSLPWNWLHNGLEFLQAKNPIVSSSFRSFIPQGRHTRLWMQRFLRAEFLLDEEGSCSLTGTLDQLRDQGLASPEFLFVPGHMDEKIRRMIYREAEVIEGALTRSSLGRSLARFHVPERPVTPQELSKLSMTYQALHFAGPVSHPAESEEQAQPDWMAAMASDIALTSDQELEDAMGLEGEVLGVDPITSLLDDVSRRFEETQLAGGGAREISEKSAGKGPESTAPRSPAQGASPWLLEDGPVGPEAMEKGGGIPPLVYSNSYQALTDLGQRFISAGASTFIGPVAPLFSRPARIFSGYCYQALGNGWSAGPAVWKAANSCRRELGTDHPAWLSYGVHGYGSLALQYL